MACVKIVEFANRKKIYCPSMVDLRVRGLANRLIGRVFIVPRGDLGHCLEQQFEMVAGPRNHFYYGSS